MYPLSGKKSADKFLKVSLREAVKNYLADFFPFRGVGYPPFLLRVSGQDDFR